MAYQQKIKQPKKKEEKLYGIVESGDRILKTDNKKGDLYKWKDDYIDELIDSGEFEVDDKKSLKEELEVIEIPKKEVGVFD